MIPSEIPNANPYTPYDKQSVNYFGFYYSNFYLFLIYSSSTDKQDKSYPLNPVILLMELVTPATACPTNDPTPLTIPDAPSKGPSINPFTGNSNNSTTPVFILDTKYVGSPRKDKEPSNICTYFKPDTVYLDLILLIKIGKNRFLI